MKYLPATVTLSYRADLCTRCGRCSEVCPLGVFRPGPAAAEITDRDLCIECGACARNCPASAITVRAGVGCAAAVINGLLTGGEPVCGCGEAPAARETSCRGGTGDACGCATGAPGPSSRGCC
jgi:ferredoxin